MQRDLACAESRFSFRLLTYNNKVEGRFTTMDRFRISKIFSSDTEPRNKSENQFWCKTLNNENALYKSDGTTYTPIKTNSNSVVVNVGSSQSTLTQYLNDNFATIGEALESLEGASANKQDKSPNDNTPYVLLNGATGKANEVPEVLWVYTSGSNTVQDGSLALPFHSISAAVSAIADDLSLYGYTVMITPAQYTEIVNLSNLRNTALTGVAPVRPEFTVGSVTIGGLTCNSSRPSNLTISAVRISGEVTLSGGAIRIKDVNFIDTVNVTATVADIVFENCYFNSPVTVNGGMVNFKNCIIDGGDFSSADADVDINLHITNGSVVELIGCRYAGVRVDLESSITVIDSTLKKFESNAADVVTLLSGRCIDFWDNPGDPRPITVNVSGSYSLGTFVYKAEGSVFTEGARYIYNGLQSDQVQDIQTFENITPATDRVSDILKAFDQKFGEISQAGDIITDVWTSTTNTMSPILSDTSLANKKGRITISPKITNVGAVYVGQSVTDKSKAFPLYPDQIVTFAFGDITNFNIGVDAVGDGCNYVIEFGTVTISDNSIEGGLQIRGSDGGLYKLIPTGAAGNETFTISKVE